jgi:hypothetical protein
MHLINVFKESGTFQETWQTEHIHLFLFLSQPLTKMTIRELKMHKSTRAERRGDNSR